MYCQNCKNSTSGVCNEHLNRMKTLPEKLYLPNLDESSTYTLRPEALRNIIDAINKILDFLQPEESNKFKDISSTDSQRHKMMQDSKPEEEECKPAGLELLSNPPQRVCMNCGQMWYSSSKTPICKNPNFTPHSNHIGKANDMVSKLKSRIEGLVSYNLKGEGDVRYIRLNALFALLEEPME